VLFRSEDRLAAALELARRQRAIVVLKGCGSIIATPDGQWFINPTGNAGLASAGSGDVLTGMIAALLAQHWPALEATLAAVHLHGAAADRLAAAGTGPIGLTAGEIIGAARNLLNRWTVDA
jgi:NAD(P)H-hydrate repair Nnr-like enzyme with NAD(P)H-hydrate dehydratase domain